MTLPSSVMLRLIRLISHGLQLLVFVCGSGTHTAAA